MFIHKVQRFVQLRAGEGPALGWSFLYFFLLLGSYYVIRPIRTEMVIVSGIDKLHWLALAVFVGMLVVVPIFGWMTQKLRRHVFLNTVYVFFSLNLLVFYLLFNGAETTPNLARAFYVWVGVFNLFVVSVFWSFMADIFDRDQSRRLFATIAAGGTCGALIGPIVTALLVEKIGISNLFLVAATMLMGTLYCIQKLRLWKQRISAKQGGQSAVQPKIKGGILDGIKLVASSPYLLGICILMCGYSLCATLLSIQVAEQVEVLYPDSAIRTRLFAIIDSVVNFLTLVFQLFLTSRLLKWLRMARMLAVLPVCMLLGFVAVIFMPVIVVYALAEIVRRAFEYGINKPAREMLYVPLAREEKYKAKNFIDTGVHRGADLLSTWVMAGFRSAGFSSQLISGFAALLATGWLVAALRTGKAYRSLSNSDKLAAQ